MTSPDQHIDTAPAAADDLGVRSLPLRATVTASMPACPRCDSDRTVNYGARCGCRACGATWQAPR